MISQAEYLRTSFESPEPDYVEGELVERPFPNYPHSRTQIRLCDAFWPWDKRGALFVVPNITVRLAPERIRVVDFAVFVSKPEELAPCSPPYAIIEIVSDDKYQALMSKFDDFEQAGVDFVFLAQPSVRKLSRYDAGSLLTVAALDLPAYQLKIPADSLFD